MQRASPHTPSSPCWQIPAPSHSFLAVPAKPHRQQFSSLKVLLLHFVLVPVGVSMPGHFLQSDRNICLPCWSPHSILYPKNPSPHQGSGVLIWFYSPQILAGAYQTSWSPLVSWTNRGIFCHLVCQWSVWMSAPSQIHVLLPMAGLNGLHFTLSLKCQALGFSGSLHSWNVPVHIHELTPLMWSS